MTPTAPTESLTLALKLKAEVERVCGLLDEKDARIAALESELAAKGREVEAYKRAKAENDERFMLARDEALDEVRRLSEALAHIAALPETYICDPAAAAIGKHMELTRDRDRERSRREALEREVRGLLDSWCLGTSAGGAYQDRLRAILDRSAEQDSTAQSWGIYEPAQKRWWPRRFPTRLAAEEHRAQCSTASTGEVRELPRPAEQDEPHAPPRRMNDGDTFEYPCAKCHRTLDGVWGNAQLPWCPECFSAIKAQREPEPRMSVSEAQSEPLWIAAMREADRAHHYSGDRSEQFWERVNALENPEKHAMYSCGVLLQNLEESVLRWLDQAEANQKRAAAVRRGEA